MKKKGKKKKIGFVVYGWGGQSPASHCGEPGSITGQSMCSFWWTNWH
jgi:hypothetical protein